MGLRKLVAERKFYTVDFGRGEGRIGRESMQVYGVHEHIRGYFRV